MQWRELGIIFFVAFDRLFATFKVKENYRSGLLYIIRARDYVLESEIYKRLDFIVYNSEGLLVHVFTLK